jgi:hypothetical protein
MAVFTSADIWARRFFKWLERRHHRHIMLLAENRGVATSCDYRGAPGFISLKKNCKNGLFLVGLASAAPTMAEFIQY